MEESAIKGLQSLGLNDRDAEIREIRGCSEISVEGFENCSLQKYALKLALRKHFASCGKMLCVSVFKSVALMRLDGAGSGHKALKLSGTDVGGWTAIVKAAPYHREPYACSAPTIKSSRIFVSGYDTWLPEIDIQLKLCEIFSSCGEVTNVILLPSKALITIEGETCVEKALKLSGLDVGGMNLVVVPQMHRPGQGKKSSSKKTGYTLPCIKLELAKEKKMKKMKALFCI